VIITSHSLKVNPKALWTAQDIFPPFSDEYQVLRNNLGLGPFPLHVVVTASGKIDPSLRLFQTPGLEILVLTTSSGAAHLAQTGLPAGVIVKALAESGPLPGKAILQAAAQASKAGLILSEAGPQLTAHFLFDQVLDELFLTLAPQVAGRDGKVDRKGFVDGKLLAPNSPRWSELVSLKRSGEYLFLRYRFSH
jgi:riboflavin biosynthesis pyrimidine reductase